MRHMMRLVDLLLGWPGVVLASVTWLGLVWFHSSKVPDWNDRLQFAVGSGAALGALYALFWQVQISRHGVSNHFMSRWNEIEFRELRHQFGRLLRPGEDEIVAKPCDDAHVIEQEAFDKQRRLITTVLNPFEEIGLAIRSGRAEDAVLQNYYSGILSIAVDRLKGWIGERQSEQNGAFENVIWLNDHWKAADARDERLNKAKNWIKHFAAGFG
jgi:hypothetical protein